ncbi:MAG: LysR family transcriptional regulator [Deltaproteobacteria bacterium]|nr:LysR family transcriptional regulator [Deltaproteobacteria bacterium]
MALESIDGLRVFVRVVDSGSLTAAGRVLGLSPTLVSRRLRRLEADLGAKLLQRTTRSQHLTEEGRRLYPRARAILAQIDDAEDDVRARPGEPRGVVRAVLPTVTRSFDLMARIKELLARHPDVGLQLSFSDQPVDLVGGGWDVAVHIGPPPDSSHVVRRLARVRPRLAATPDYLAARGIPRTPQELTEHECLRFISDRPQDTWLLTHDDGSEVRVPVGGRLESDNSYALAEALVAGLGIGLVGEHMIHRPFADGLLQPVLPEWSMGAMTLYALVPSGRHRVPRVRAFVQWLMEFMAELDTAEP